MKPFEAEAHKTKRTKMGCVTGSPENFESGADKAARFCRGGYADGGEVPKTMNDYVSVGDRKVPVYTYDQAKSKDRK